MGYRTRLGRLSKKDAPDLLKISLEEWKDKGESPQYESPASPKVHEELFEIGKYFHYESEHKKPFYPDPEILKYFESEFEILEKEGLKGIIQWYHNKIIEVFSVSDEELLTGAKKKLEVWNNKFDLLPYWLDEERTDGAIVRSWLYEYAIFNLVHIYRTFDWENDYLIYSAW